MYIWQQMAIYTPICRIHAPKRCPQVTINVQLLRKLVHLANMAMMKNYPTIIRRAEFLAQIPILCSKLHKYMETLSDIWPSLSIDINSMSWDSSIAYL